MTGWRLGWVVAPEWAVATLDKLAQNIFLAAPTPAQYAALAAFTPEALAIMEAQRQELQRRRDFLLPALRELGFSVQAEPQGAFYIYAGMKRFGDDAQRLCREMLDKTGVVFTPGMVSQADTHVRFAHTTGVARLEQAVERLGGFLRRGKEIKAINRGCALHSFERNLKKCRAGVWCLADFIRQENFAKKVVNG